MQRERFRDFHRRQLLPRAPTVVLISPMDGFPPHFPGSTGMRLNNATVAVHFGLNQLPNLIS